MRLTVIVPGYRNSKQRWQRCIFSLLRSIGESDRIVCIDDGSDYSRLEDSWLSKDGRLDERITIVRLKENAGLAAARNYALSMVESQYVTFVDSDDEVVPGVYDECVRRLEDSSCDIAVFGVKPIWVKEGLSKDDFLEDGVWGKLSATQMKLLADCCLLNYACNKVYSVSFLNKNASGPVRFDVDGMPCEDIIFNLECVMRQARWCVVSRIGYIYYRDGGSSLSRFKKSNMQGLRACADAWGKCRTLFPDWSRVLGDEADNKEEQFVLAEWRNIWMPQSPYSLLDRIRWCAAHRRYLGRFAFLKMLVFSLLRKYCYFRFVRRWNIRRTYGNVVEYSPVV